MPFPWENMGEVTHGCVGMVKLLPEQLVFANLDWASILKQIYLSAIASNVTSLPGQSEVTRESEI